MASVVPSLRTTVQCTCGHVKLSIDSPSALRLVCYCKDCRGYYNTLNNAASFANKNPVAILDPWGGTDWTQIYPRDIQVLEGKDDLKTCIIRPGSKINRVHSTCCYTPMFTIGPNASLLNTYLIKQDGQKPPVRFRIIGRQSTPGENKPKISWSVPPSWFWVMPRRIKSDLMKPMPIDINEESVSVLENFQEG